MVQEVTNGIKVSVVPNFEGSTMHNYKLQYLFSYQITIENLTKAIVQLKSRNWYIYDAAKKMELVEGIGVVGKQPVIHPSEKFTYTSNCYLTSPNGAMKGYYYMLNLESGIEFKVKIPTFQLVLPSNFN